VFVKQLGVHPIESVEPLIELALQSHAGSDPDEWPEDLRVREFPR